ncbi:polyprenyl synthetase family protein [Agromyces salentinus]|uniref:Polyprenyl synthetase family protein n=1 Tax=Agromyces salentinus TaxID=269421 RepID=A0ABN2MSD3_9MICO|nr:polyprenyl synthetase family protein [Agromyces salentinus]
MADLVDSAIEVELGAIFADARRRAGDLDPHYAALWHTLAKQSSGGKRIRPQLVRLAYAGFGGIEEDLATRVAVAFELLHTAFLIHDDVIDRDTVRRGGPNVAARFAARAIRYGTDARTSDIWGETAAVLAGDLALSRAHREIALLPVEATRRARLLDILDRAVFVSAAGELADVVNAGEVEPTSMSRVLATLEQKTAVYSFECPLAAGAVLAGAPDASIAALERFGRFIGVAFQITDDILGVFGDPAVTGKSISSDLREGKRTALIAHAATTAEWPRIAVGLGDPALEDAEAEDMRTALRDCGALDAAMRLADEHVTLALYELEAGNLPEPLASELAAIARRAVERAR